MNMKNDVYYANVAYNCVKAITLCLFAMDFILLIVLLA